MRRFVIFGELSYLYWNSYYLWPYTVDLNGNGLPFNGNERNIPEIISTTLSRKKTIQDMSAILHYSKVGIYCYFG